MLEYSARITSQEPFTDIMQAQLAEALGLSEGLHQLAGRFAHDIEIANGYIDNAFANINNLATAMASDRTYTITSSGYVG